MLHDKGRHSQLIISIDLQNIYSLCIRYTSSRLLMSLIMETFGDYYVQIHCISHTYNQIQENTIHIILLLAQRFVLVRNSLTLKHDL